MKAGNLLLTLVGVALAGMAYMVMDVNRASAAKPQGTGGNTSPSLSSAIASGKPVLLEFYADWCGPCKAVGPLVDEFSREIRDKARVVKVNVDQQPELAKNYEVRGIPVFIALKGGKETARQVGAIDKGRMRSLLGL